MPQSRPDALAMTTDPTPAGIWPITVRLDGVTQEMTRSQYLDHTTGRHIAEGENEATARGAAEAAVQYLEQLGPSVRRLEELTRAAKDELLESLRADRFVPGSPREEYLRRCLNAMTLVADDLVRGVVDNDGQIAMVESGLVERTRACLRPYRRVFEEPPHARPDERDLPV